MDDRVHIHVYSLVFPDIKRDIHLKSGRSLRDMLTEMGFPHNAAPYLTVSLDGEPLPESMWGTVPAAGAHLSIGITPAGDFVNDPANKDIVRNMAVVASVLGGYLIPGALGVGGVFRDVLTAAIIAAGSWAATTLIPVIRPRDESQFVLSGARNQVRPYGAIPKTYGRQRIYPPLAAKPITQVQGDGNYIRVLLCAGYKPTHIDLDTFKIGNTPLSRFQGVRMEVNDGWRNHEQITLFSGDIEEQYLDVRLSHAPTWLVDSSGDPIPDGYPIEGVIAENVFLTTTPDRTTRISIDFNFPNGLGRSAGSTLVPHSVHLQVQYRPAGMVGEAGWITHIPDGTRVFNREIDKITRAQCVEWIGDLATKIGDVLNGVEVYPTWRRALPVNLHEHTAGVLKAALTYAEINYSHGYIAGETAAQAAALFQIQRAQRVLETVQRDIDEDRVIEERFIGTFQHLIVAAQALKAVFAIRSAMGDQDVVPFTQGYNVQNLTAFSEALPDIIEEHETDYIDIAPTEARAGSFRKNVEIKVDEGRYEVRVRKVSEDLPDDQYRDQVNIVVFRVMRSGGMMSDNMLNKLALIAVDLLATDQLTGSLDQLSVEVESPLRYTEDGVTWVGPALTDGAGNNVSRNPAWVMADILTQAPNYRAVPFSRLDGPGLLEFAQWCTDNAFHFDHTFEQASTVHRCLQDVCRVAKASPTIRDGLYSVVHDKPQSTARAVITLTNAAEFESGKTFQKRPQCLRIPFRNPARDWMDDELFVYDDGFGEDGRIVYRNEVARADSAEALKLTALYEDVTRIYDVGAVADLDIDDYVIGTNAAGTRTVITPRISPANDFVDGGHYNVIGHVRTRIPERIEEVQIPGLVDVPNDLEHAWHSNQVYKLGRYLLATAKLRPEVFSCRMDFEQLVFERGDRVEVQMDTVLWGLGSSRIAGVTRVSGGPNDGKVESVTVEQDLFLEDATGYVVRFRNAGNNISGEATFTYSSATPRAIPLDTPYDDSTYPLAAGDLVAWGEPSKTTISCLVQEIRPLREMAAEVTLIQYSPGVFVAEDGPIPEFDPLISIPPNPERQRPPSPSIEKITTDESVLERDTDGSLAARIVVDIRIPEGRTREERDAASRVDQVQAQYRRAPADRHAANRPSWIPSGSYPREVTRISIRDVEDRQTYDVRLRAVTSDGLASEWREQHDITVIGKTSPPPDVQNLRWVGDIIKWDYPNPPADLLGYLVRYAVGDGAAWANSRPAHPGPILTTEYRADTNLNGRYTYFVKAVDTSKNASVNAASVTRNTVTNAEYFEVVRDGEDDFSADFTDLGGVWRLNAYAGSQAGEPFWKGSADMPFWHGAASDSFWWRTYPWYEASIPAWWAGPYPGSPDGRWVCDIDVVQETPYLVEAKVENSPLWPAYLNDPIWPEDLSSDFWPKYFDYELLEPGGIPDRGSVAFPDGLIVRIRLTVYPSNTQFRFRDLYLAYLAPLRTQHLQAIVTDSSGNVQLSPGFKHIEGIRIGINDDATYPDAVYTRIGKGDGSTIIILAYDKDGVRVGANLDITVTGY